MSALTTARRVTFAAAVLAAAVVPAPGRQAGAQSTASVDFARDVQPILQQRCIGCHGPTQQSGGYRLDRRREALAGGVRPMIIPGNSGSSRLYRRIIGSEFGTRMPTTGPLPAGEIDTLTKWIDQGAAWPDALANDAPTPAPDSRALQLSDAIRAGDLPAIRTVM